MKKTFKIIGITLLSLVGVILIVFAVLSWYVFTPSKLTSIVNKQLPNYLTCPTSFEKVDLTLFKTFPNIGIEINNLLLVNPKEGSPSDTLAYVESCIVSLNLIRFLKNDEIIVKDVFLKNSFANLYVEKNGNSNLDIFPPQESDTTSSEFTLNKLSLDKFAIKNMRVLYNDYSSDMFAVINNFNLDVSAKMENDLVDGKIVAKMSYLLFQIKDSISLTQADLRDVEMEIDGNMNLKDNFSNLDLKLKSDTLSYLMSDTEGFYFRLDGKPVHLKLNGKGLTNDFNGDLDVKAPVLLANYDRTDYLTNAPITIKSPVNLNFDNMLFTFKDAKIDLYNFLILAKGYLQMAENDDIVMDFNYDAKDLKVKELLQIIPADFSEMTNGINIDGLMGLSGTITGIYNDSLMPLITANIDFTKGTFSYPDALPYQFHSLKAKIFANIDMNVERNSNVVIHQLYAKTGENSFDLSGKIDDMMNNMYCNLKLQTKLHLSEWKEMIPEDMNVKLQGWAEATINAKVSMPQIDAMALDKMQINGTINLNDLDVEYNDSIFAKSSQLSLAFNLPSTTKNPLFLEFLNATIDAQNLNTNIIGTGKVDLAKTKFDVGVSNIMDSTKPMFMIGNFDLAKIDATIENMVVNTLNSSGSFAMYPANNKSKNTAYTFNYKNDQLNFKQGDSLTVNTGYFALKGSAEYDEKEKDLFLQWHPSVNIDFKHGEIFMTDIPYPIHIPTIVFDFTPERFHFTESSIILGKSHLKITGDVSNIENYWRNQGLLTGVMELIAENIDLDQIMEIVSGFGATDSTMTPEVTETESPEDNPFMVPLGVDFRLNTKIKNASIGTSNFMNIGGHMAIKDGVLVLEEYGFTTEAARMQLTAMYRSPRKNHLFAGLDFHLLDIDIHKLIEMIPTIDTLVPMLKSFEGNAEFHLAAETYLKSNYEIKMSTLRGAAALEGRDLYLESGNAFNKIASYFVFDKQGKVKVDSLNVEMTVFRNEIDLYPFLIVMDKFKAVISGRHNLDMNCNYNVDLVESPLPIRIGLEIKGNANDFDHMKFITRKPKYPNLFRPQQQGKREAETLRLKNLIKTSLQDNVKTPPSNE